MSVFLQRCFQLAWLGAGYVSPNPLVGAVLVHNNRIIGEGRHQRYGEAHAEVNCLASVRPEDRLLIPASTLYCSLEPCSHYGKTPPCADLIIRERIPRVIVSNADPNPLVAGRGLQRLREAGVAVTLGPLAEAGEWLNRMFFRYQRAARPWVALKWAQSADGFIGRRGERTAISGPLAQRLVHRWRVEYGAVLVGAETARIDNPRLDNRLYPGRPPLRVAIDTRGALPAHHHLLDDTKPSLIIGPQRPGEWQQTRFLPMPSPVDFPEILNALYRDGYNGLLVEGGAQLLQHGIDLGLWDEILVIHSPITLGNGIPAPRLPHNAQLRQTLDLGPDKIERWENIEYRTPNIELRISNNAH